MWKGDYFRQLALGKVKETRKKINIRIIAKEKWIIRDL